MATSQTEVESQAVELSAEAEKAGDADESPTKEASEAGTEPAASVEEKTEEKPETEELDRITGFLDTKA